MTPAFRPEQVETLAAALPPDGANPIGKAARAVLVNRMRAALPGYYEQFDHVVVPYRTVFAPNYSELPEQSEVDRLTGLYGDFWARLSVATLCQQMYWSTTGIRGELLPDKIDSVVSSAGSLVRRSVARWYARMAAATAGDIRTALAEFPDRDSKARARAYYITGLTSDSWINSKLTQYGSGMWTNQSWELFHHWIKLAALDASDEEIDNTIATAISHGLPVPGALRPENWRNWSSWFGPDIRGADLPESINPLTETLCQPTPKRFDRCFSESRSYAFTASGGPGSDYRKPPSSSCFGPGTKVVMADGALRNIDSVAAGDRVRTPGGDREVVLVATSSPGTPPLYRFGDTDFTFTAAHPFLLYHDDPKTNGTYAAVDPRALADAVPTAAQFGIRPLAGEPPPTLTAHTATGTRPVLAPGVSPATPPYPAVLYDLFLDVGPDGRSEYFAGDGTTQYLVSSESPRFLNAPMTTDVLITVLERCAPGMLRTLSTVTDDYFQDMLNIGLRATRRTLLPTVGQYLLDEAPGLEIARDPDTLSRRVTEFARSMSGPECEGHRKIALVERFVALFGPQFEAAIAMGWRTFDTAASGGGMVLAVSVYSVQLYTGDANLPANGAMIRLALAREGSRSEIQLSVRAAASTDDSYYVSDDVGYFDIWRPVIEPPNEAASTDCWSMELSLETAHTGVVPPFVAGVSLPWRIGLGFETFTVPMLDAAGRTVGQVQLDVRSLDSVGLADDLARRAEWTPAQQPVVAANLARLAGDHIELTFAGGLRTFARYAVRTPADADADAVP